MGKANTNPRVRPPGATPAGLLDRGPSRARSLRPRSRNAASLAAYLSQRPRLRSSSRSPSENGAMSTLAANHVVASDSNACVTRLFPNRTLIPSATRNGAIAVPTRL